MLPEVEPAFTSSAAPATFRLTAPEVELALRVFTLPPRVQKMLPEVEPRKYDPRGFIVFITTHSEMSYMTFIYKLEAMDFILKDDEEEMKKRVYQCLMNADERFASKANALQTNYTIKTGDKRITIDFNDIMFFETSANNHKVILHCTNRIIEYNARIKDIEKELDSRFYRCHRSFLVNKNNIKEIDIENRIAYMVNGEECLVSARQAKGLK